MPLDFARARQLLVKGDLRALFIEELGWDRHSTALQLTLDSTALTLSALAQKRGMVAYKCPTINGERLPDYAQRRKIEHQVAKAAHEHIIVFTDGPSETQVWQWVKREPGKPAACREHTFHHSQSGDALLQKLETIAFTLQEEETLTLTDVTRRARTGFDVERVTKRFYDRFQKEHTAFLKFITGIRERADHEWYASVMLNRLMFVYFIQRKGFLDGDRDYLRNRLNRMRDQHGRDKFYSFYRYFLLRLFHEGLGGRKRSAELEKLVGRIPYLNGGLFDVHELEKPDRYGKAIQIPDQAFERIFDFFDAYQWHLDERPLRRDDEINPDVLGYIFEKYINQKQMGAYYTKEDITEYIGKNTVLPFLFDAVRAKCKVAFENPRGPTVWDLLKNNPNRYIYSAVRHGASELLPDDISAGLNPPTLHLPVDDGPVKIFELRKDWNRPAPPTHALPTENWREVVARRKRYEDVKGKLAAGEVRDVNNLITLNLDVRQFAQDVIESCEGPDLLRAIWQAIEKVTILDPTCGSGAFLFAALDILEPLYEACLDRMEAFLGDLDRSGEKHRPEKFSDFRKILGHVAAHPNRRYFIFKSIILNNLFGVDIMEEAVEICKLRLFLKLAAQVDPKLTEKNFGIEPLPDIDFNIRAGNTLVGYVTADEVRTTFKENPDGQGKLMLGDASDAFRQFEERVGEVDRAFKLFRQMQTDVGMEAEAFFSAKQVLRERLKSLATALDKALASTYGVDVSNETALSCWCKTHIPFHWFVEFYGIISNGGFDAIVGNPPYVEISDIGDQYSIKDLALIETGNLYAVCLERIGTLVHSKGRAGVIVPISAISTPRMLPLMQFLTNEFFALHFSNFAVRPAKLFNGVDMNLTVILGQKLESRPGMVFSTAYNRWNEQARPILFDTLSYGTSVLMKEASTIPKVGDGHAPTILDDITKHMSFARLRGGADLERVYYHSGGRYFRKCLRNQLSNEYKELAIRKGVGNAVICLLSSSLYYWFWIAVSDCYHVTRRDIDNLPVPDSLPSDSRMNDLATALLEDLWKHADKRLRNRADGSQQEEVNFHVGQSKAIIDEIDKLLSQHYGLTQEQLDFIKNYDIKYRFGNEK